MNKIFGERYIVKSLRDDYELHGEFDSVDAAKKEIDDFNKRAISQGYPAHRFNICKQQIIKVREDNGFFASSTVVTTAVAMYPEEL